MTYNQTQIDQDIVAQQISPTTGPKVIVKYGDTDIHTLTGPVPTVDISYTFNNNSLDLPETITTNITLNGKIYRRTMENGAPNVSNSVGQAGITGIMSGVIALRDLFTKCGVLEIRCDGNILHKFSRLNPTDIQFNNSNDNWAQSADYTISLQSTESIYSGVNVDPIERFVTDRQDTWSIEPLEDAHYTNMKYWVDLATEASNPKLNLNTEIPESPPPISATTRDLEIINLPQFRISRRLSAKGLSSAVIKCYTNITEADTLANSTKPYIMAKTWVEKMARQSYRPNQSLDPSYSMGGNNTNLNLPYAKHPFANVDGLFLFNHIRTTNIDIYNGSYEINDSWVAMPSGIPYTETYTVEASTSEDFIKSVRVAGNIVGLMLNKNTLLNSGVLQSGSGINGIIDPKLSLNYSLEKGDTASIPYKSLDTTQNNPIAINFKDNKYENALEAWTNHIKPLLYRRASLLINSKDRTFDNARAITSLANPGKIRSFPYNPMFSKENILSLIPISTSEGHDPRKGTISYTYEFSNKNKILGDEVLSENINISYENPVDSTAEIQVIGRSLGPIIQRTGRSLPRKTISIDVAVIKPTGIEQTSMNHTKCPLHRTKSLFANIEKLIEAHRPYSPSDHIQGEEKETNGLVYATNDSETWNPTDGKYSRSVSWTYQQETLTKDFRSH